MSQKKALITGITGQDGAILADILLGKGYEVHGLREYSAVCDTGRIAHIEDDITLHYGDMSDGGNIMRLLESVKPDEIYNLAAMSHVHVSFDVPEATADINALGPLRILEAMRNMSAQKEMRLYQASSSEMFGRAYAPQNEDTKMEPCSPYGNAKLYAYWSMRNYREAYGLYAANGILFNHESAYRGEEFVTRKIIKGVCEIEAGLRDKVTLGNLDSQRDWGHAQDYMEGAWQILQQDTADDFVLATGQSYAVRDFVERAFAHIGTTLIWDGAGLGEKGRDKITGQVLVEVDSALFRPKEIHQLLGDAAKAKKVLGWKPKITFDALVADMMQADRIMSKSKKPHAA